MVCKQLYAMVYTVTSKKALVTAGEEGILNLKLGGPCRARTYDPLIKSQLLYQLS